VHCFRPLHAIHSTCQVKKCVLWLLFGWWAFSFPKITIMEIQFIIHSFARQTFELCAAHFSVYVVLCIYLSVCWEVYPHPPTYLLLQSSCIRLGDARVPWHHLTLLLLSNIYDITRCNSFICIFHSYDLSEWNINIYSI